MYFYCIVYTSLKNDSDVLYSDFKKWPRYRIKTLVINFPIFHTVVQMRDVLLSTEYWQLKSKIYTKRLVRDHKLME